MGLRFPPKMGKGKVFETAKRPSHLALGEWGELLALEYLIQQGFRIVATNLLLPIGYSRHGRQITGEIDIVCYDESTEPFCLAFVEVKTRTSSDIATPEAAVDFRKQRKILRAAKLYRRLMDVEGEPHRYDVVSIVVDADIEISLLRNYFGEYDYI